MYRTFRDRAGFAFVYIAEAHSVDGWQMSSNEEEGVLLLQHTTLEERFAAARDGVERMGLTLPVLVDGMDNTVSEAFAAWPERLFVVGGDGVIAFHGGPGPFEFDPDPQRRRSATLLHRVETPSSLVACRLARTVGTTTARARGSARAAGSLWSRRPARESSERP